MADLESAYNTLDPSVENGTSVFDAFGRSLLPQGMLMTADDGGVGVGGESETYMDDTWSTSAWSTAEPGGSSLPFGMEDDPQQMMVSTPLSSLPSSQLVGSASMRPVAATDKATKTKGHEDTKAAQKAEKQRQQAAKQDFANCTADLHTDLLLKASIEARLLLRTLRHESTCGLTVVTADVLDDLDLLQSTVEEAYDDDGSSLASVGFPPLPASCASQPSASIMSSSSSLRGVRPYRRSTSRCSPSRRTAV
jgi:hypothetical protein